MTTKSHNLDIHMYSLKDILELFNLTYNISIDDIKRAKKQLIQTHPDKSKLPSEYFLFYKKAFDILITFYNNQNKQNQKVDAENSVYTPSNNENNDTTTNQIKSTINDMSKTEFNTKFNKLFNDNMVNKIDETKNDWFKNDDSTLTTEQNVNQSNMSQVFDTMKDKQQGLVRYRGVENLIVNNRSGTNIYDDNDDEYVYCDPFEKLKYDDLRKVHKDQTIFSVSEKDINKVKQYSSVDQFMRDRGSQNVTPIEKHKAEQYLSNNEEQHKQRIMHKEYESNLQTMKNQEKNQTVLSSFLHLTNG
jgi:hypothetical protein|tara:strand:- start:931 stop:1839 length:909 start_codon:yes stop_codon:yes gene_type:complete